MGREGKILSLLFLSFLHMLEIYFPCFKKCSLTLILDDSDLIDISRLAVGAKNGLKIKQKYSVLTRKLKKTTFKMLLLIDRLTILPENLHKGTSQ